MAAGRPRKPTKLKLIEGTIRADRFNEEEPEAPPADVRTPPDWLPPRSEARRLWRRVAPVLSRMGVLTVADTDALALLCSVLADVIELEEDIRKKGREYESYIELEGEKGETIVKRIVRPRPQVAMLSDARRMVKAMWVEFGMTPSARSRVKANTGDGKKDPFDAFMGGKKA